jgi:PPOX class F420-dependent enzyme/OxyR family protein
LIFTRAELDYLATQHIGRLATVSPDRQIQNNPTYLVVDADAGTIVIGGGALGRSKKFRNVQRGSVVAFVVDDLATVDPWAPQGHRDPRRRGGADRLGTAAAIPVSRDHSDHLDQDRLWGSMDRARAVRCEVP